MEATEQDLYDSIIAPEQTENTPETPTEATTEAKAERARDATGKFISKAPEATSQVEQEAAPQPEGEIAPQERESDARVPSWRLAEESQRRREAEQAVADLRAEFRQWQMMQAQQQAPQRQPEPIDPFADPNGFAQSIQGSFEEKLKGIQLENSLRFARYAHKDTFDEAYSAFIDHAHKTRDQATYQRVMTSADPGEALVQWHKEQQLHQELGGSDLKTFLEKQREEWMKDPAVQAKVIEAFKATQAAAQPSAVTNLPPSLSRATSAAPMHGDAGEVSMREIYNYAKAR